MKRILIIFSVILITILPLKIVTDNIYKNQVKTNKFSKVIKMEKKHQDKSLIINDELFYYKFNDKKIYSTDSKEFNLFLKNLVNNIKLFLEKKPNVNLMDSIVYHTHFEDCKKIIKNIIKI